MVKSHLGEVRPETKGWLKTMGLGVAPARCRTPRERASQAAVRLSIFSAPFEVAAPTSY